MKMHIDDIVGHAPANFAVKRLMLFDFGEHKIDQFEHSHVTPYLRHFY